MRNSITDNRRIMLSALKSEVIPRLREKGFTGTFPHFRRCNDESIDLISFQTNKYGGAFLIEVSAGFPASEDKNYQLYGKMTERSLNVTATNVRYRLPGMFDGPWFCYCDVYHKKRLLQKTAYYADLDSAASIPKGWEPVQLFDEKVALMICQKINAQFMDAFAWLEKFKTEKR